LAAPDIQKSKPLPSFVEEIIDRLRGAGYEAYIVGGAVRDMIHGRPLSDWDVATNASLQEIRALFSGTTNFSLHNTTVTLVYKGRHYEVSTYRSVKNTGKTILEDLSHRDFTINAMAYDVVSGVVLDPHGGKRDIECRLVRAVEEPEERFKEDPIRLLRAIRIANELGFTIEKGTMDAISGMTELIGTVAVERIRDELVKILACRKPSIGFNLMLRSGLLKRVIPELVEGYRKRQNEHHKYTIFKHVMVTTDLVRPDPVLRLAALFHDIAKPRVRKKEKGKFRFLGHEKESAELAREIMYRLRFSKQVTEEVSNLILHHMAVVDYNPRWGDAALRRLIRRIGAKNMDRFLAFRRADQLAHGKKDEKLDLLWELEQRVRKIMEDSLVTRAFDLAIDGRQVMNILGLREGPEVGRILKMLVEKVTDNPELNTVDKLVDILKGMKREGEARHPSP